MSFVMMSLSFLGGVNIFLQVVRARILWGGEKFVPLHCQNERGRGRRLIVKIASINSGNCEC